jgi:acyl-CoA synthetase (AMP-forming)/AMP-acid ligase II
MQIATHEISYGPRETQYCLGLLPFSHNLALMAVAHLAVYRGDGVVVLPSFDLQIMLQAIQKYKMGRLWTVCFLIFQCRKEWVRRWVCNG